MASAIRNIHGCTSWFLTKKSRENHKIRSCHVSACATNVNDPYKILKIHPNASQSEVKKAFRKLALQHHPDVCNGNKNEVQFHHINEAYNVVMSQFREDSVKQETKTYEAYDARMEEVMMEMDDYELWEEWMGWEGAGIRDYSSHINPYL